MSELLFNWLNDQVQLSRRVTNFDDDFNNGYLFGEILSKYSQQLNFNQFIDKDDKASRINNFTLLYDTFKTLKISFDSNAAMSIMNRKKEITKKVLSQLKMQLQKTTTNAFSKINKPSKPLSPLKKIKVSKDQFDKVSKEHFNKQLNELHRAQKDIIQENHLKKFPQFHEKQLVKAHIQEEKEAHITLLKRKQFRQRQIDNTKKSADFRNDWEMSNIKEWTVGMAIRKMNNEKDFLFKTKQQNKKVQAKTISEMNALQSMDKDIDDFEKRVLGKSGDDSDSEKQDEPKIIKKDSQKKSMIGSQLNFDKRPSKLGSTFVNQGLQMRAKKSPQVVESMKHQRQKRRRKMIVEQNKRHQMIQIERRQKYIITTIEQTSKQEKEIEYEIWRAWQNKEIIIQNKENNKEKDKEKEETRVINAKFKDDELLKTYRQQHKNELKNSLERQNKLKVGDTVKNRKSMYNECRNIIEQFIDMTQSCYIHEQETNKEELDPMFLNQLFDEFVESAKSKSDIAKLQLKNYIEGKGQWNIEIKKEEEESSEPTEDNSVPSGVVNNYYLGNILKTVFEDIYTTQSGSQILTVQSQNLISLLGLQFSGKKMLAQQIKNRYGFETISIDNLISKKLEDYQILKEKGVQISPSTEQLVSRCYAGKQVPNNIIIQLLKEQVQKYPKSVIIDYPKTYEECVQFTKVFGGVSPTDRQRKSKLANKIQEFSRLVKPTEANQIERSLKPCGLDFALWIDVEPKTSLDRFLGRRWIGDQCYHLAEEITSPNELVVGEKASPIILKNDFKLNNKKKLENWLKLFGIKVKMEEGEYTQSCWQTVQGGIGLPELTQNVFKILDQGFEIKRQKNIDIAAEKQKQKEELKKKEERQKFEAELKEKCALSAGEEISAKVTEAMNQMKMSEQFLQNTQTLWNSTEKMVINSLTNVFQALRTQDEEKNKHIAQIKRKYIDMLTRSDERFFLVKNFQNEYNKFVDQNPDMLSQEYTKEQLHQRIEDLETDLLTIIEDKKDEAVEERNNIMNSGWLESQLQQFFSGIHVMLQTQINRSNASQQIINDFYTKKYFVPAKEIEESQIQINVDNTLDIIKQEEFPRLQKLITEAMRIFNKEEEAGDDKNKKGGKQPPKKEEKKGAKKGGKEEAEEKGEPTPEELELKKAINTEKAIFRYRVKVIHAFALKKIKQIRQQGLKMYSSLEDMKFYTDKVQKKSVIDTTNIFKKAIEKEAKIEHQVQINYVQVLETELIRNFEKPKPVIEPAVQKISQNRFSISDLRTFMKLLKNQAQFSSVIKNKRLVTLLQEFSVSKQYENLLPETWRSIKKETYQKFVKRFDKKSDGQIELWIIFIFAMMANFKLPSAEQVKEYQHILTNYNPMTKQISKEQFLKVKSWFDEEQEEGQNIRKFERKIYLKQLLFEVMSSNDDTLPISKYLNRISLSGYRNTEEHTELTYTDFAFNI